MATPRITVGLPAYKGADLIGKALDCLQRQTYDNFEAIISIDGNDEETAAACRSFLSDTRFHMVVQPERLDWVGNFNWLLQQKLNEFFCYRQHDDTTAPEFFEVLLKLADEDKDAAAIYCDCQDEYDGVPTHLEISDSIVGEPVDRLLQYFDRYSAVPLRGLIRSAAIRQAGLVRADEFRAPHQVYGWLAKLLRWGNFRRLPEPLYYKLDHPQTFTRQFFNDTRDRHRAAWPTIFTGALEAAMPLCHTPQARLVVQQALLYRIVGFPRLRPHDETTSSTELIAECMARLKQEGNAHLLRDDELPAVLRGVSGGANFVTPSPLRRGLYRIGEWARLPKILYPESRWQRLAQHGRQILRTLKRRLRL